MPSESEAVRVLIVAHKTAATPALQAAVRARAQEGPARFTLLVPALAALAAAGVTAWAEPALAPLPRASEAAERLVVLALEPAVPAAAVVSALRGG